MGRTAITIILIIGLVACLPLNPEHATNYATNYATNTITPLTPTPTPPLTPSTTPLTRATNICVVVAWWLNVRQEPGIEHPAIGHYERGETVTILREARARDGGRWGYTGRGWINLRFVNCRPDVPLIEADH
jgi:uncharacterized protein YgiM (DUF1202 family)